MRAKKLLFRRYRPVGIIQAGQLDLSAISSVESSHTWTLKGPYSKILFPGPAEVAGGGRGPFFSRYRPEEFPSSFPEAFNSVKRKNYLYFQEY